VRDRKILKRESFLNLSWFSYLNSKVLIMFILSAIQTLLFVVIGNKVLDIRGMAFSYWLVLFTTSCFGNMLGLNLSSAFKSVLTIYILIPFIIIPQLLFSGVMVKFDSLHIRQYEYVPVIGDLMIARWSFEAMATEQFRNNDYEKLFFDYDAEISEHTWNKSLVDVLKTDLYNCSNKRARPEYVSATLNKVRRYSEELSRINGIIFPQGLLDSLKKDVYDVSVERKMNIYFDSIKTKLSHRRERTERQRDSVILLEQMKYGPEWLNSKRENYDNLKLREVVLNPLGMWTFETENKIIRKFQPGFMKPTSRSARAHFYAPVKTLGQNEFNTYWFNTAIIWILTVMLYMVLYFRLPQKFILLSDNLRMKKPE
jgi:hypothetical protein